MQKAFCGPLAIKERVGTLDPRRSPPPTSRPCSARSRRSTASRAHGRTRARRSPTHVRDDYDGDAARVWTDAKDAAELRANLEAFPGSAR